MKLLVTGGAGFIGSNFIRYWLRKNPSDQILNLDALTYAGHLESLKDVSKIPNYMFIKGDIRDKNLVERLVNHVDVIVHFAAESHVDRSIKNPQVFLQTNILGTYTLLEACVGSKISRFHHVSTDEVFGQLPLDSKIKFNEKTPYDPRSPYSASKAASDHLVRSYYHTFGIPVTITNASNNFGPFQDPEKFIPRMITNLILGRKIPIYGDGKYVRDWLYVEDHVRAIEAVLQHGEVGQTYLVGGLTRDISNIQIARKLVKLMGKDRSYIEFVKDRPGHDRRYAVDWSKIRRKLKWKPQHKFDEWLKKTVDWYKKNEWWWGPLKEKSESIYK